MDGTAVGIDQLELAEASTSSATKKELKSAPKIFKPTCEIAWNQSVATIHDFVRGLSPYPAAWTTLINSTKNETKTFKIIKAIKTELPVSDTKTIKETKEGLLFPSGDYYLLVSELQPEGKRRMNHREFLAGNKIEEWKLV
jgi:methionyl-tRNA formyltransferase